MSVLKKNTLETVCAVTNVLISDMLKAYPRAKISIAYLFLAVNLFLVMCEIAERSGIC